MTLYQRVFGEAEEASQDVKKPFFRRSSFKDAPVKREAPRPQETKKLPRGRGPSFYKRFREKLQRP